MRQIPVDGLGEAALEIMLGFPAECGLGGRRIDFVAKIMAGPVGDETDQAGPRAFRIRQAAVELGADGVDDLQIAARLAGADAIGVAGLALHQHLNEGDRMVLDEEPVALVGAVAVDGKGFAFQRVEQDQRDELLGELPDAVVVGGVRDEGGKAVGVVPGADQMVGRGLGSGIGAARIVGRRFHERRVIGLERAEDLVRRDVMEAEIRPALPVEAIVVGARGLEQGEGAHDVGAHEVARAIDRAVDMTFGRQMHHRIRLAGREDVLHCGRVGDIGTDQLVAVAVDRPFQRIFRRRIGHRVDIDDGMIRIANEVADDRGSDKATATGNQQTHRELTRRCFSAGGTDRFGRADQACGGSAARSYSLTAARRLLRERTSPAGSGNRPCCFMDNSCPGRPTVPALPRSGSRYEGAQLPPFREDSR